jgi:dATP pyrophosphohydrolase
MGARPYKRPESVLVVVCTAAGEVLMLRRREPPDFWQSVTGSLRWGETARHAAQRELYEETGLRVGSALEDCRHRERFPIVGPWRARYAPSARFNLEHWFRARLPARRTIRLNPAEHLEWRWLDAASAARIASSWTNRAAIERLVEVGSRR